MIERQKAFEDAASHLERLAAALHEKSEAIAGAASPFASATSQERDAAVMAHDFELAAKAVRELAASEVAA